MVALREAVGLSDVVFLLDGALTPSVGYPARYVIDSEVVNIVGGKGTAAVSVVRGVESTTIASHAKGAILTFAPDTGLDPTGVAISALPAVVTPAGTDEFPVNQAGETKKMTLAQISAIPDKGLLAFKSWGGAGAYSLNGGAATVATAIDTTNLRLHIPSTFAGGTILIRLTNISASSDGAPCFWGIMEGATPLAFSWLSQNTAYERRSVIIILAGVAAGAHDYDWFYRVTSGTLTMLSSPPMGGSDYGPATMEAFAA